MNDMNLNEAKNIETELNAAGQVEPLVMQFFKTGVIRDGYGDITGIILNDDDDFHGVFSISSNNGKIIFYEECDGYFYRTVDKATAIKILEEAINWVKSA